MGRAMLRLPGRTPGQLTSVASRMKNGTLAKIALTAAVVIGGGGFLVKSSLSHAQHYKMVDELVASGLDQWKDKELKVHGMVEGRIDRRGHGRIRRRAAPSCSQKEGKKIRVFYAGPKPDTFKDRVEVVATGPARAGGDDAEGRRPAVREARRQDRGAARSRPMPSRPTSSTRPS